MMLEDLGLIESGQVSALVRRDGAIAWKGRNCLAADFGGAEVGAALLQAVTSRLPPAGDPLMRATTDAMRADLEPPGWLKRSAEDHDPTTGVMGSNHPQPYSHLGLSHAAFAASPRRSEFA